MNADKKKQFVYELLIEYVRQNNLMKDNALDKDVDRLWYMIHLKNWIVHIKYFYKQVITILIKELPYL